VAKMVCNMPTTRTLLDRLETDSALRRICGWERKNVGTAGAGVFGALIERGNEVPTTVKRLEEAFFSHYVPNDAGGQTTGCRKLCRGGRYGRIGDGIDNSMATARNLQRDGCAVFGVVGRQDDSGQS
jgi:hypothetical protein